ncbi:hypothetical protein D9M69_710540 [compost metagenome]
MSGELIVAIANGPPKGRIQPLQAFAQGLGNTLGRSRGTFLQSVLLLDDLVPLLDAGILQQQIGHNARLSNLQRAAD